MFCHCVFVIVCLSLCVCHCVCFNSFLLLWNFADCVSGKFYTLTAKLSFGPVDHVGNTTTMSLIHCCLLCERNSQCENVRWKETDKQCEMMGHFYALANDHNPDAAYQLLTRYKYHWLCVTVTKSDKTSTFTFIFIFTKKPRIVSLLYSQARSDRTVCRIFYQHAYLLYDPFH